MALVTDFKAEPQLFQSNQPICRLCLSEESLVNVFEDAALPQRISDCLSIMISTEDCLSQSVCTICRIRLSEFEQFRIRSQEVQAILRSNIPNVDVYVENKHKNIECGSTLSPSQLLSNYIDNLENRIHGNHDKPTSPNQQHSYNVLTSHEAEKSNEIEDMIDIDEVKIETGTDDDDTESSDEHCSITNSIEAENGSNKTTTLTKAQPRQKKTRVKKLHRFQCKVCHKVLHSKQTLWNHKRVVHGPRDIPCHICGIGFPVRPLLKRHELSKKHLSRMQEVNKLKDK